MQVYALQWQILLFRHICNSKEVNGAHFMNNPREWNPYYVNSPYTMNPEHRAFPWLYPYGSQMNYWNLWDSPERMED